MVLILRWSYFRGGLIARFYCNTCVLANLKYCSEPHKQTLGLENMLGQEFDGLSAWVSLNFTFNI